MGEEAGVLGGPNCRRYEPYRLGHADLASVPGERAGLAGLCSGGARGG